jgi:outer membrane protein OmpA-like peptidoglycan-associated protein
MDRILGVLVVVLALLEASGPAAASDIQDTLARIERRAGSGVEVWVNERGAREVDLGAPMKFHLRSDRDAYLTAIYLSGDGSAAVFLPGNDPEAARIRAGQEKTLPSSGEAYAQLPLGGETVLAVGTEAPISLGDLGLAAPEAGFAEVEPDHVPALLQRLEARIGDRSGSAARVARADFAVVDRRPAEEPRYTADTIVETFVVAMRAVRRPKLDLDLDIKFDFGSDHLTPGARRDLDEVAKALEDPKLSPYKFALAGHTDDVGDDSFNQKLSEQRARAARRYLVEAAGVEAARLDATGRGETQPVIAGASEEARAANRRVELQMVR